MQRLGRHLTSLITASVLPTILAAGMTTLPVTPAHAASPGCAAVNNGLLDISGTTLLAGVTRTVVGTFYTNEVLTMTITSNSLAAVSNLTTTGLLRLSTDLRIGLLEAGTNSTTMRITGPGVSGVSSNLIAVAATATVTVRCAGVNAPTTTTVTTNNTPTVVGQPASFTATVATPAGSAQVPSGNVAFTIGGTTYPAVALTNGAATFTTSALPAGNLPVSAAFASTGSFAGSTGSGTNQVVNRSNTTTTVSASANPTFGGATTFTATTAAVAPGGGAPDGNVIFTIGTTEQAPVALSNGVATLTRSDIPAGSVAVTARYVGSTNYNTSSGSLSGGVTIAPATTTTTLSQNSASTAFGEAAVFRAQVSSGSGQASGSVVFTIDNVARAPVTLTNGVAEISVSDLAVGPHTVSAAYQPTANFRASSATLSGGHAVTARPTTTTLSGPGTIQSGASATITATVAGAGGTPTGSVIFTVDGQARPAVSLANGTASVTLPGLSVGNHTVSAAYSGTATYAASTGTLSGGQVVAPANTTLSVSAAPATGVFGTATTFSAAVNAMNGVPTGNVIFTVNGTDQPAVSLSGGVATLTRSDLAVDNYTVAARYEGTANFVASSGALAAPYAVGRATPSLSVTSSANPSVTGQPVQFTAAVSSPAGTPTGTIIFTVDGTALPPVTLSGGSASIAAPALAIGDHSVSIRYSGDGSFVERTGSLAGGQKVSPGNSTLALSASPANSAFGTPVTVRADVGAAAPATGTPTGQVTFSIDGTAQAPVTISGGTAALSLPALAPGNHVITAVYGGNTQFNGSTATLSGGVTVAAATTTTSLGLDPPSFAYGQSARATARVAAASGAPLGEVFFSVNGTERPAVTLRDGSATLDLSGLSAGQYTIGARYAGSANHIASAAPATQLTIGLATPTVAVGTSSQTVRFGDPITLTAQLSAPGVLPGGSIEFLSNGTVIGTAPLVDGRATVTTSSLAFGSAAITARFAGNANLSAATGALAQPIVVAGRLPTASIALAPGSAPYGQDIAATVTVRSDAGSPTGSVTLTVAGTDHTANLVDGNANFTLGGLPPGTHPVTAVYVGAGAFLPASAAAAQLTVTRASTAMSLSTEANELVIGDALRVTAALSSNFGVPQGEVVFSLDGADLPAATISGGRAALTVPSPGPGEHTITARYAGSATHLPVDATLATPIVVTPAATTLTLAADQSSIVFGETAQLTARIAPANAAGGTVIFTIDGVDRPAANFTGGLATVSVSGLTVGPHTVEARYIAATGYQPTTATLAGGIAVTAAQAEIALSAPTGAIVAGQPAVFTVSVASPAGTVGGDVVLVVDGVEQSTVALDQGAASLPFTFETAGNHTVEVRYRGSENFAAATAVLPGPVTVTGAAATITVAADPAEPLFGQPVTVSATISSPFAVPTGVVVFERSGVELGRANLADGIAALELASLPPSASSVTARYLGDQAHIGAQGAVTIVVGDAQTSLDLAISDTGIYAGEPLTLTVTLASSAGAVPGEAVFILGGTEYLARINGGVATVTIDDLVEGTYPVSARFDGAPGFAASETTPVELVVAPTPADIALSALLPRSVAGEPLSILVIAVGGVAPFEYAITSGALPEGVSLDPQTGIISGTPAEPGAYEFTVTTTGVAGAPGTLSLTLEVLAPAEIVLPDSLADALFGQPFTIDLSADGGTAPYRYSLTGQLPAGVTFDAEAGALAGTPRAVGDFTLTLAVSDANGFVADRTYGLIVAPPTIVVAADLPEGGAFVHYAGQVTATGGAGPYGYAVTAGALPSGLTLDPQTGAITGTPRTVGETSFTVTVTDADGFVGTIEATIAIAQVFTVVLDDAVADGRQFRPYAQTLTASGGAEPYSYAISGSLPVGLAFNDSTGLVSGTPTEPGSFTFTVTAIDSNGISGTRDYALQIAEAATLVVDTAIASAVAGTPYEQTIAVSGGAEPYEFLLITGILPAGVSFDAETGTLAGTPTEDGVFPLVIEIVDANGDRITQGVTLSVAAPSIVITPNLAPAEAGVAYNAGIAVTGAAQPASISFTGFLPAGLAFDSATASITGTPTEAGTFPITVTVIDANGYRATADATLTVGSTTSLTLSGPSAPVAFGDSIDIEASVTAAASGPAGVVIFTVDGQDSSPVALVDGSARIVLDGLTTGPHTVTARLVPAAGFDTATAELSGGILVTAASTEIAVSVPATGPTVGVAGPLTVTVSSPAGTPTGDVIVTIDGTDLPAASLVDGTVTIEHVFSTSGNHAVGVRYVGSDNFAAVVGALSGGVDVAGAPSTLDFTASPQSPVFGQPVTLSVEVTSNVGIATGLVVFNRDGVQLGTATLENGIATLTVTDLPPGDGVLTAIYAGDAAHLDASATLDLNLGDAATTLAVAADPARAYAGAPVTLTATLASDAGAAPGTIVFAIGDNEYPAELVDGTASITLKDLSEGSYSVAARYDGGPGFASTEASLADPLVIDPALTDIELSASVPRSVAGEPLAIAITATGGVAPYGFAVWSGTLPAGLDFNATTGAITGMPTTPGTYSFTVTATGAAGAPGSIDIELVVLAPAQLVVPGMLDAAVYGVAFVADLVAAGGTAPYSYNLSGNLPSGVAFDAESATLSGTPTSLGIYALTLEVTDVNGFTVSQPLDLVVSPPTLVVETDLPGAGAFVPYDGLITVTGGTAPYRFAVTAGAMPDGVALDAQNGAISGTPRTVGEVGFTVTITDANGFSVSRALTLDVERVFTVVLPETVAAGREGRSFAQLLEASGGTAPYGYEVSDGALPPGLELDANSGLVSGTPSAAGTFSFTVTATDSNTVSASQSYTLVVVAAATLLPELDLAQATQGAPYGQSLTVGGGAEPYGFTLVSGTLPDGLSLDAGGTISGTPTASGTFAFVVEIIDDNGDRIAQRFELTVQPPALELSAGLPPAAAGTPYLSAARVSGGVQPILFSLSGDLPAGISFDAGTGTLSGTPTTAGTFPVTLFATDARGVQQRQDASLAVSAATELTLAADPATVRFGETVQLTASIASPATNVAGTVIFRVDGLTVGETTLSEGRASLALDQFAAGPHAISAEFVPADGFAPAEAELSGGITVTAAAVEIAFAAPSGAVTVGAPAAFTVSVSSSAGVVPGEVIFTIDGEDLGPVALADGEASVEHTFLTSGPHTVSVRYVGSENFAPSSAVLDIAVAAIVSDLSLAIEPETPVFGQPVTLTATVASALGEPTGTVVFSRNGVELGRVALDGGSVSLDIADLAPGATTITARYLGDAAHEPISAGINIVAADAQTTLALAAGEGPIYAGAPLALTATLTSEAGTPSGEIIFAIGGTGYPATLAGGVATLTVPNLPEGSYEISARYAGQDGFGAASAALPGAVTVEPAPTAIVATVTVPRSVAGTPLAIMPVVTGGVAPYAFAVTFGTLPDGLEFDAATGAVSGIPETSGTYGFTIAVSGAAGAPATIDIDLVVLAPAELTIETDLPPATFGSAYSADLSASGGTAPYNYRLTGALPAGLGFDGETGLLSGTPTVTGSFQLTLEVTDANGFTLRQTLELEIDPPVLAIEATLPEASGYLPYEGRIDVDGGIAPYRFAVTEDALPDGLRLDPDSGAITGTTRTPGSYGFNVTVTDANGFFASVAATITVVQVFEIVLPESLAPAREDRPYGLELDPTGGTAPYAFAIEGALPEGLDFDAGTGIISGTPTASGSFAFTITVTDANRVTASRTYTLAVAAAATLVPSDLAPATAGTPYQEALTVSGGAEPYQFELVSALPAGLEFDAATGTVSGTPTQAGTFGLTVAITDANGDRITHTFVVAVEAPTITLVLDYPPAQAGESYTGSITLSGGAAPVTLTLEGPIPAGMEFDPATGNLSGTPTAAGRFPLTIIATDANGFTQSAALTLDIAAAAPVELVIGAIDITPAIGSPFEASLAVTGGTAPYAFTLSEGMLPPGLSLVDGTLSGTPTRPGTYTFAIEVEDSAGNIGQRRFTFDVPFPDFAPSFPVDLPPAAAGTVYDASLAVTGPAPLRYALSGPLPAGLTLDPQTGHISGTPVEAGSFAIEIAVTNGFGQTSTAGYTLTVAAPQLSLAAGIPAATGGLDYSAELAVAGGTEPYVFQAAEPLPAGLTLSPSGAIFGTPTSAGNFALAITVRDANGFESQLSIPLTIAAPSITIIGELPTLRANLPFDFTPATTGGTAPYGFTLSAGTLPEGLQFDAQTGRISGAPTRETTASVTLNVTDTLGFSGERSFIFDVASNAGTAILPGTLPAAQAGVAFEGSVAASGGAAPLTYAVTGGALPADLALDPATGAITGTPRAAGTSTLTITVTDAEGRINAQVYTLIVEAPVLAIDNGFPVGQIGQPYTDGVTVTGGIEPYRFTLANAPRDLTINAETGVISGIPRQIGTFQTVVSVTDDAGHTEQHTSQLVITAAPVALVLGNLATDLVAGTEYVGSVAATNASGSVTYRVVSGALPEDLALDPATGELRGIPAGEGSFSFTVEATDTDRNSGTRAYTLTVAPAEVPDAPVDISVVVSPPSAPPGTAVTIDVTLEAASGPATDGTATLVDTESGNVLQSAPVGADGRVAFTVTAEAGERSYRVDYSGAPGFAAATGASFTLAPTAAETGIALVSTPVDPAPGAEVEFTATVELLPPAVGPAPAGSVTFLVGNEEMATVPLVDGVATTSFVPPVGTSEITARYTPDDGTTAPSETTIELTIAGEVTVTLSGPQGALPADTPLDYTVTVEPVGAGPVPTGTVSILVDGTQVANAALSDGAASFTLDPRPAGDYEITATYSDGNYPDAVSSPVSITVGQAALEPLSTDTILSPSTANPVVGDAVTLTVRVNGRHDTPPTGLVRFFDDGAGIGTGTLNAEGQTSLLYSFTATGGRNITALYVGDAINLESTDRIDFTVGQSPTRISLESNADTVGPDQSATLTAEFSRAPEGRGQPNVDVIQFIADDEVFASVPINGADMVQVDTPDLEADTQFTAKLVPDPRAQTDIGSTSNVVTVSVAAGLSASVTDLTITPAAPVQGTPVTLTAVVSDPAGIAIPTGSVRFTRDGDELGTVALSGGNATLTRRDLSPGASTIVAEYLGSTTFTRSDDSESLVITPLPGPASLTLSGSASPSVILGAGQAITLSFQVGAIGGTIDDIVLSAGGIAVTCPQSTLLAGATMTCTATYIATLADAAGDTIAITATVTGTDTATGTPATPATTTITLASQVNEVSETFEDLTQQYMAARARMVTGIALPNILDRRMAPNGSRPGALNAQADETSQTLHFATSLEHLRGYIESQPGSGPRRQLEPSPFNIWFDTRIALHGSNDDESRWSRLAVAAGGIDYLVNDWLLVGIAAQADWMDDRRDGSDFSGTGYLVGPYASIAITDNLSFDAAVMVGGSSNDATATIAGVTYSGDFETERLLATAGLKGLYEVGEYVLRPSATFFLSTEQSDGYVVTDGTGASVPVPSQELLDLQLRGGLTIERAFELENGATLTPQLGLNLTYGGTLSDDEFDDRLTGGIMGGLLYDAGNFSAKGSIEAEFGTDGFEGVTGRISITGKF